MADLRPGFGSGHFPDTAAEPAEHSLLRVPGRLLPGLPTDGRGRGYRQRGAAVFGERSGETTLIIVIAVRETSVSLVLKIPKIATLPFQSIVFL